MVPTVRTTASRGVASIVVFGVLQWRSANIQASDLIPGERQALDSNQAIAVREDAKEIVNGMSEGGSGPTQKSAQIVNKFLDKLCTQD